MAEKYLPQPVRAPFATALGANQGVTLTEPAKNQRAEAADPEVTDGTTVYVCVTCRKPDDPESGPRPGFLLACATAKAAEGTDVTVHPVECLGNCSRSLSAAMRCQGAWTYVFGGLEADRDSQALIDGARLLAGAEDGILPWRERPDILKRALIARVPPLNFTEDTE